MGLNIWCSDNSISLKSSPVSDSFKFFVVLVNQGIHATGFKHAQGNAHCAKFESHTNRVTFETNAIRMTSSVQAHCITFAVRTDNSNDFRHR